MVGMLALSATGQVRRIKLCNPSNRAQAAYVDVYDYDFVAERNETLRNMREYVLKMKKKNNYIPNVPYMDEIIKLPSKKRVKIK